MTPPVALTVAGSDSGGGAGVQADLATFSAFGVHGASVVTALTAQNTVGVQRVHVPPLDFLDAQLDAVLDDLDVRAAKTGMLATEAIVRAIAARAARRGLGALVVDPVLVATSGDRLLDPGAETAYLDALFPAATIVTPNSREAAVLLGREIDSAAELESAAEALAEFGPEWVVVKGGHLPGHVAVDVLWSTADRTATRLEAAWITTANNHGTGCTFAAATAAMLARGAPVPSAVGAAKTHVHAALQASAGWTLGSGHGPVSHLCRDAAPPRDVA
jgi:hydroxymethylpyrimidine/phosphomethylpyrimidine kinase